MSGHPRFYELLDEMKAIHDKKNADYSKQGDPLSNFKLVEAFGIPAWEGCVVRISDKYSRLVQLTQKVLEGKEPAVKEESIKDTLIDMANYCLLCTILLEEWMKEKKAVKPVPRMPTSFRELTSRLDDAVGLSF